MYSYGEALKTSIDYFGNELSAKAFVDKYALRDNDGNILEDTPDKMHKRIAKALASVEKKKFKKPLSEKEIYGYLENFKQIIPQGSPMYGIGNKYQTVSLSNCFVLHEPDDSYGGIMFTDEQLVQISKRRGGVGISLNKLRPEGTRTNNASSSSTGIISWMKRYSNSIREVGQAGRRGALMLTLNVHHPQILDFIKSKDNINEITGANISVQYTDEFLQAVKNDKNYEQRWPLNSNTPEISKIVKAKDIWKEAVHSAWKCAEPGLQFIDNVLKESPADCYSDDGFQTITSNPCSEIFLSELDSCRLLVVNLFSCVDNPFTSKSSFNYDKLYEISQTAQRLMDDIVDLELEAIAKIIKKLDSDPEPGYIKQNEISTWRKIHIACLNGRRTGTGITALGDVIASLGIKYGTPKSIKVTEEIYKTLKLGCYRSSVDMAKELKPFPVWNHDKEKNNPFLLRIKEEDKLLYSEMSKYGRRNIAILTTAPTGTTSMMAGLSEKKHGTTSGIEPLFNVKGYTRRKKGNPGDEDFRSDFIDQSGDHWMEFEVNHPGIELWSKISNNKNLLKSPYIGADNIDWTNRVKLQAAANKHVDHSISSTINLPNDVEEEEISNIYTTAWKSGLKGITVYRDGCRSGVLINNKEASAKKSSLKRPKSLPCDVYHISVKGQPYFVFVGLYENRPYEIFAGKNGVIDKKIKSGQIIKYRQKQYKVIFDDESELCPVTAFTTDEEDIVTRLISANLRNNIDMQLVVDQLRKAKGDMTTFAKSIAKALAKYIPDGTELEETCPECELRLIHEGGCIICRGCGHSRC